ncbi:MAG: TIM barrel protein [Pseudomonadota bacterium]
MIGLSTSWRSSQANNGKELMDELITTGVEAIELEYRITHDMLREIIPIIKKRAMPVLSVHNFCPVPDSVPRSLASADVFLLSSVDKEERKQAIRYSIKTIQLAHDLETKAVVFHVGHVDMDPRKERLFELFDRGEIGTSEGRRFVEGQLALRKRVRQKNLDSVLFGLDRLSKVAEKLDVYIGVENRYHFHQIPDFEEIGIILREFEGSHIGYWHDVGHANVQERFGILNHGELLSSYSSKLLGMHIHDHIGYDDHYAPGTGEFDFDLIKKYLNSDVMKIMEIHPKVNREDLLEGLKFLKSQRIE